MSSAVKVTSEIAYDLLQDHLDTVLAVLHQPLSREEVVDRLGSENELQRMLRHGLFQADGGSVRAVAGVVHQLRQEGMLTFLNRYVLPALTASLTPQAAGSELACRYLSLPADTLPTLRDGAVQSLWQELGVVSEQPTSGPVRRLTVLVVGTSDVERQDLPDAEAALLHTKRACAQRARPGERALAVLSQLDFLADGARLVAATEAVQRFLERFDSNASSSEAANYHLTVAWHWHQPDAEADFDEVEARQ